MNVGALKHRIKVYKNTVVRDKEGFKTSSLSLILSTKCEIYEEAYIDNRRGNSKNMDSSQSKVTCILRYSSLIDPSCIVELYGSKYRISSLSNVKHSNHEMKMVLQIV